MLHRLSISIAILVALAGTAFLGTGSVSAGGGCHAGRPVTDERSTMVTMSGNCFVATIARVDEGATVTFINQDDAAHMVTGANFSWGMGSEQADAPQSKTMAKGDTLEWTFAESGVYPYFCILHPSMVGAIVVGDGAAAATSGSPGAGTLASSAPQRASASQASGITAEPDGGGASRALTVGLIAAGAAVLVAIVALARRSAARRPAAG
jgi:plastocyanin